MKHILGVDDDTSVHSVYFTVDMHYKHLAPWNGGVVP